MRTCRQRTVVRTGTPLLGLSLCLIAHASAGQVPSPQASSAPISGQQAEAILEELRQIRRVLEKIEQQGLAQAPQPRRAPRNATVTLDAEHPALGAADAPVTVVEFTDYQCPFCRRFSQSIFPFIKREYIDTGKVRWVVRDLPLAFHPNARTAGQAAHCAQEQGKFWEMRDTLFKNSARLGEDDLYRYAQQLKLDVDSFEGCLASDRYLAKMDKDSEEAKRVRITGTPTFVVGKSGGDELSGTLVVGAQPLKVFKSAIDKVLPQAEAEPEQPKEAETR